MKIKTHKNFISRGFTLIELLVVIAIIGILSSVVLASLNTARIKGQDAARISNVKSLEMAMELYYNDNGGYPTSNNSDNGDVGLSDAILISKLVPNYIPNMPALLVTDGDRYYSHGVTSGVSTKYTTRIYMKGPNSWCLSGTVPNSGAWGILTDCKF